MIGIAVLGLASLGLVASGYFALVAAKVVNPQNPRLPGLCRMDERTYAGLLHGADARIFGAPNVAVALLYYGGLVVLALQHDTLNDVLGFLTVAGAFTVVLGIYLTIRQLVVHRARCTLCLALHLINLLLFVIFLAGL